MSCGGCYDSPPRVSIELRARPNLDRSAEDLHRQIVAGLELIPRPWGLTDAASSPATEDLVTIFPLTFQTQPAPVEILESHLSYALRSAAYLRDAAQYDDQLVLRFVPAPNASLGTLGEWVARSAQIMGAYRGALVVDEELAADDWEACIRLGRESGRDIDGRDSVFRIWPVSFWDTELCRRAWGLSPEHVATVLAPLVQESRLIADGVLVIASDRIPSRDEVIATSDRLQAALTAASAEVQLRREEASS